MPVATPQPALSPPTGDAFSGIQSQILQNQQDLDKSLAPIQAEKAQATGALEQEISKPLPEAPQLQQIPQFQPRHISQQEAMNFSGIAMAFAALASLKTREPFAAALNAAGDAMKGFQQGNLQQAKIDIENFNTQSRAAIAQNQQLMQQYNAVIENRKLSIAQKQSMLSVIAAKEQDEIALSTLKENRLDLLYKLMDSRQRASEQFQMNYDRLHESMRHNLEMENLKRQQIGAQAGAPGGGFGPDDIAKAIAEYRMPLPSSFALRSPYWQGIMAKVVQMNPQFDATLYQRKQRAETDMAAGLTGRLTRSFNVFIQHTDVMRDAVEALRNGNIQQFNRASQAIAQQTGYPAPTTFDAVKQIYGDELIKAIVGTGGNVSDRERASEAVNRAQSPEQLLNILDNYDRLMAGQVMGVRHSYETATGRHDYDSFLLPKTLSVLKKYGYTESSDKPEEKRSVSKSGKPIVFRDGAWHYAE